MEFTVLGEGKKEKRYPWLCSARRYSKEILGGERGFHQTSKPKQGIGTGQGRDGSSRFT